MKLFKYFYIVFAILFILGFGYFLGQPPNIEPGKAHKGVLDLRDWKDKNFENTELSGEWEFYWDQLLTPADFSQKNLPEKTGYINLPWSWIHGIKGKTFPHRGNATYRLKILLGTGKKNITFFISKIAPAFILYANGKKLLHIGEPGKDTRTSITYSHVELPVFLSEQAEVELILQTTNFIRSHSNMTSITIGTISNLIKKRERSIAFDIFMFGSILFMGLYHFGLFFFRRKDTTPLYFAIFCLFAATFGLIINSSFIIHFFPNITHTTLMKLAYLFENTGYTILGLYIYSLFRNDFPRLFFYIVLALAIITAVIITLTPWYTTIVIENIFALLKSIGFFYIFYILIRASLQKRRRPVLFLGGLLIIYLTHLHDNMVYLALSRAKYMAPLGLFIFIFFQAYYLLARFSRSFAQKETLSEELQEKSFELSEKNIRLLEMDRVKDEFLANTSHELRTPLNGIIGIADSMIKKTGEKQDEELRQNLSLIATSGTRLSNLINDILDSSKLKNRDIELKLSSVCLRSLVDVVFDLSRPLIGGKDLELRNTLEPEMPPVKADENRLHQVLLNLVGNAIKFTESGSITVSAVLQPQEQLFSIIVSDTGIGIPKEKQDIIFQSFEQADGSISREYGGTGIGLSIARQLIELHNGKIWVESEEGKGSRFIFTLRASEKKEPDHCTQQEAENKCGSLKEIAPGPRNIAGQVPGKKGSMLVVDDDPVNLQVVQNYLAHEEYSVVTAANGVEALELIKSREHTSGKSFDLILLDIMMPKISGYEVSRLIREQFSLYELPVIMLTARAGIDDLVTGFEAGANDYLTKPLQKEELLARVRTLLTLKHTVKEHKEARFKILQDRMGPHFLFNALNSIHYLIYENQDLADEALLMVAHNFRFLMDQSDKSLIPFDEEWEFVNNYLALEQIHFGDGLIFEMKQEGDFSEVLIPPLTIQPLVENSLKHGLGGKKGDALIQVLAKKENENVDIRIVDNGIGLRGKDLFSRSLGNILKRLRFYYEEADIKISNRAEGGVEAVVSFWMAGK
ncbi:MAG: response regulator [bacterium]|nr:response regulator [bacterium]